MSKYRIGSKNGQPFHTKKHSIFAARPRSRDIRSQNYTTIWTRVDKYMIERFISYDQVKYFSKRHWIAVTSCKNRIYVCELCTEEIDNHLEVNSCIK